MQKDAQWNVGYPFKGVFFIEIDPTLPLFMVQFSKFKRETPSTTSTPIYIKSSSSSAELSENLSPGTTDFLKMLYYLAIDMQENKGNCGTKSKLTPELKEAVQEKLDETWSPEQIIGRLYQGKLSFKSIYRWIYSGLLEVPAIVLRQKGKRQKPRETRGRFNIGTPISKRPKDVQKRETFGHRELDTVVSGRGQAKGCVATFIERKTRWYMADRSALSMETAVKLLHQQLLKGAIKTATTDRRKECSCYTVLEKELNIQVYFADPYPSW